MFGQHMGILFAHARDERNDLSSAHLLLIARPVAEARFLIYPRIIFCCFVGDLNHTSARPDIGSRNL